MHDTHEAALIQLATANVATKVVYTAAKLGLADELAAGPKAPAELAAKLGAHAQALYRLMRTCAGFGIFTEADGKFRLTPAGELLRSDHPRRLRSTFLTFGGPMISGPLDHLEHSVRTGEPSFPQAFDGADPWEYLGRHPEIARQFTETMIGFHGGEPPAVAEAYDFDALGTIVDVGGASGNLLAHVLARHPRPRGVLFDLPHVVADAPALLAERGVASRVSIESGSFFDAVPAGGDAYLMSHIIHDWSEDKCLAILANIRKAMKPTGRVLIVEMVLPPGDAMHPGKLLDMIMLAIPGGTERTEAEYAQLYAKAGFRLSRVVPTASAVSVVEAVPA